MTTTPRTPATTTSRAPADVAEVVDLMLSKGLIIDGFARIAPLGTPALVADGRVVIASMDRYLGFADAVNHIDL